MYNAIIYFFLKYNLYWINQLMPNFTPITITFYYSQFEAPYYQPSSYMYVPFHLSTCMPSPLVLHVCLFPSFYMYVFFPLSTCMSFSLFLHVCLFPSFYMYVFFSLSTCMSFSLFLHVCLFPSFYMYAFSPLWYVHVLRHLATLLLSYLHTWWLRSR